MKVQPISYKVLKDILFKNEETLALYIQEKRVDTPQSIRLIKFLKRSKNIE